MQTSRFQLGLIATLALGLGFSLSSAEAVGYPAGAAVSVGSNPVQSGGSQVAVPYDSAVVSDLVTAPDDHDLVITDLRLSAITTREECMEIWTVSVTSDGETKAHYGLYSGHIRYSSSGSGWSAYSATNIREGLDVQLASGIVIDAGKTAEVSVDWFDAYGSCGGTRTGMLTWSYSGYLTQP